MDLLTLTVYALAAWRLAHLLAEEDGPWAVFARLRACAGVDDLGQPWSELGAMLSCIYCLSVWGGLAVALGHWLAPGLTFWLALPWAVSGGALLAQGIIERGEA
jgi:hypothetical protein